MSNFNINTPPNNIPDAIQWLIQGEKILFGRTSGSSGGSGSLTIGNPVSGGGANRVLYEDASQNLAASDSFTFSNSNLALGVIGGTKGALRLKGSTSGQVDISVSNAAGTYTVYMPDAQGAANSTLVNDGAGTLSWSRFTGQITGATGTSATATIPSGMTNCILSMKNETHPTAPYTTDTLIVTPIWNISGTTLTIYFKSSSGSLADSYTISYMVW